MARIIVVGAAAHAKYTIEILECGGHVIDGLVDDRATGDLVGYPILGPISSLPQLAFDELIVGIGDNWSRHRVAQRVEDLCPGATFATAIHPSAIIGARTEVGNGTVIMAGVVVNNDCRIGMHAFLATNSSLDHDSSFGDFASASPGVVTGGEVSIGDFSAIGIGACVLHGRTVGPQTVVGAGSTVIRDLPANVVAYGTPARVVRPRQAGDPYL